MTVSELANNELFKKKNPYFFSADTLRFFGERKSEMEILDGNRIITDNMGKTHECIVLRTYQHNAPKGVPPIHFYAFDVKTMEEIFPMKPQEIEK